MRVCVCSHACVRAYMCVCVCVAMPVCSHARVRSVGSLYLCVGSCWPDPSGRLSAAWAPQVDSWGWTADRDPQPVPVGPWRRGKGPRSGTGCPINPLLLKACSGRERQGMEFVWVVYVCYIILDKSMAFVIILTCLFGAAIQYMCAMYTLSV